MPGYDNIKNLISNPSHIAGEQQNPGNDKKRSYQNLAGKASARR